MTELRQVDAGNLHECLELALEESQLRFVSPPVRSLAQAYVYRDQCTPFCIYAGGEMVGYVLVLYDPDERTYNIWHMMIDRRFQARGLGRQALGLVLGYIRQKPFGEANRVLLTCSPENAAAYRLYVSLGFERTGRSDEDEVELGLELL